jgi:hypothetical protein
VKAYLLVAIAACSSARSEPVVQAKPAPVPDVYARHVVLLEQRLADHRLSLRTQIVAPFVVVGDGTTAELDRSAGTVRWAVAHLEADFFAHRPNKIIDIYLFHDADSYESGVKALTGETPTTPYGFYSKQHEAMFMNIATGGGTLVHEIVHPFVEADLPNAPAWLNEGLGSLFEQSAERRGHIIGLTNWRLAGLQHALARGHVPSFKTLSHYGDNEFYGDDTGVNYAASRYLLYYMQERGILLDFYRAVRASRANDPSGYATLVDVLGVDDMAAFEKRWADYVATLEFP